MAFYWLKAFHIIGVVVWFAGLFYLVRLFVYHREADQQPPEAREILQKQFSIMESRLLNIITTPGMIFTVGTASGLIYTNPNYYLTQGWMHAKLTAVACLIGYHFLCIRVMRHLQSGGEKWTAKQLRALNEVPTLLLVTIVMLVVFQSNFPTQTGVWLNFGLILSFVISIQLYAKKRRRDAEKALTNAHKL